MAKSKSNKLTIDYRGAKLEFGQHKATGQFRKKYKGHTIYLGADPSGVLDQWLEKTNQVDDRLAHSIEVGASDVTVKQMCNRVLTFKKREVETGELSLSTFRGYFAIGKVIAKHFGRETLISDLQSEDFERFKSYLAKPKPMKRGGRTIKSAKSKLSLESIRTFIRITKVFFIFAVDDGMLDRLPWTKHAFKMPTQKRIDNQRSKQRPKQAAREEINAILEICNSTWKALILYGINTGSGNMDAALLQWSDIKDGWVTSPRHKTGKPRRFKLWPETLAAIDKLKRYDDGLVFHGRQGANYVPKGKTDQISRIFTQLAERAGVKRENLSYYSLRHAFQNVADEHLDFPAVMLIMGHSKLSMSDVYRGAVSDERLEAVADHVRRWLLAGKPKAKRTRKGGAA